MSVQKLWSPKIKLDSFLKAMYAREHLGLNSVFLVVGARGVGKSCFAIRIAQHCLAILHKREWDLSDVVFRIEDALARITYYDERGIRWSFVIVDESGIEAAARDFMTTKNKILTQLLETFRDTATNLVCVVPAKTMVDVNVKRLCDFYIVMEGRRRGKINIPKVSHYRDKWYTKGYVLIQDCGKVDKDTLEGYRMLRKGFMQNKRAEWLSELQEERESSKVSKSKMRKKILEEIQQDYIDGKLDKEELGYEIMDRLGVSQGPAYRLRRRLWKQIEANREKARLNDEAEV